MTNKKKHNKKENEEEEKEYGVVLLKNKKYRNRVYPQKGKPPKEQDESYKIV
ncbi:MAG: hypothetical protein JW891_17280 [Candidatus Lokiarchaeota archaeon]|nr:hypothetical protein [Candidatus Lokiarchaeota archaeon]